MILAAGLGTRLKPLTDDRPKALVKIGDTTLIEYTILKLKESGFDEIVVNVHHFASMLVDFLKAKDFGVKIHISDESDRLMDTGGGIVKAASFLDGDEPFLVHNVDIITDIDLRTLFNAHSQSDALATLAVGKRESSRMFLFDSEMKLAGWQNNLTGKKIIPDSSREPLTPYAFSGIHVISPTIFTLITSKGPFSIVDAYLSQCCRNAIRGYDVSNNFVLDVGKPQSIERAEGYLMKKVTSDK